MGRAKKKQRPWRFWGWSVIQKVWRIDELLLHGPPVCAYCGRGEDKAGPLTVDHVVAKANGGLTSPDNLVWACRRCNQKKGDQPPAVFARRCPPNAPIFKMYPEFRPVP